MGARVPTDNASEWMVRHLANGSGAPEINAIRHPVAKQAKYLRNKKILRTAEIPNLLAGFQEPQASFFMARALSTMPVLYTNYPERPPDGMLLRLFIYFRRPWLAFFFKSRSRHEVIPHPPLPMRHSHFSFNIPEGTRCRIYCCPLKTIVCPALLPP